MQKLLVLFAVAVTASCSCIHDCPEIDPVPDPPSEVYVQTKIADFDISLRSDKGQCVFYYSRTGKFDPFTDKRIPLDMEAPCNFVHLSGREEVQSYEYGKAPFKYKIIIAVGGPADTEFPNRHDRFLPNGCGTKIQKILIYADRVRVDFPSGKTTVCPAEPIDEVFFAT